MKKALIDGTRICQIVADGAEFEVHSSLVWADVADNTKTKDTWVDGAVVAFSVPAKTMLDLRSQRNGLLVESDWTQVADVCKKTRQKYLNRWNTFAATAPARARW